MPAPAHAITLLELNKNWKYSMLRYYLLTVVIWDPRANYFALMKKEHYGVLGVKQQIQSGRK